MCQTTTTMLGDGDPHVDRHVLRNTQRKLKMEAVLGSNRALPGSKQMRTPSPQRKSILSRTVSQSFPGGKENRPVTPPTAVTSRLASGVAGPATLSPTKTTPLLGSETKHAQESLRYTSLSELVITIPNSMSDSFGTSSPVPVPRTPMKDALVEKAVRAYLQPSESFASRSRSSGWGMCLVLRQFMPSFLTKFPFTIPNPVQFFCCAVHAFSMYMTRQTMPLELYQIRGNRSPSPGSEIQVEL